MSPLIVQLNFPCYVYITKNILSAIHKSLIWFLPFSSLQCFQCFFCTVNQYFIG